MKVLVIGANGQIGRQVIAMLQQHEGHTPIAMVRKAEQAASFEQQGVQTVIGDLEGTVEQLREVLQGVEAVVFTAGSGGHTGFDKTLLIDLDGAAKTVEAAQLAGVSRYIMVSALQAHNREHWNVAILPYYAAKHYADKMLVASSLNYTIIRPGLLLNEAGSGMIAAADNLARGSIAREDVARTIVASLDEESTSRRGFDLVAGPLPIAQALNQLS